MATLASVLPALGFPVLAQQATAHHGVSAAAINGVLESTVNDHTISCVTAIVVDGDRKVYSGAFGLQDEGKGIPVKMNTIFRIASMTKPITAVAVMQLVEAGKLKLDEPAGTYLPVIGQAQVIDHIDARTGDAVMRAPKTPVTIRELLSHTSGFVYDRWDAELHAYRTKVLAGGVAAQDFKEPLLFDPGTRWEYGTSTTWLGRIVEAVSGLTLEQYFRQHILDPLHMDDTSFLVGAEKQDRMVTVHQRGPDGSLREVDQKQAKPPAFFDGGGGLTSTAPDFAVFMEMILKGGQLGGVRVLKPETVREMETNQIGGLTLQPFKTTNPQQSIDGIVPGGLDKFGLGFAISSKGEPGGRAAGSIAWAGLENTYFWIDPKNHEAAVIMMQVYPFLDPGPIQVLKSYEHAVYGSAAKR
jgi:methyl acetate hydrolase